MVGKSGQLDVRSGPIGPPGKSNTQDFCRFNRILAESFVEIAHAEKQDRVAVHGLDAVILLHQRGFDVFLFRSGSGGGICLFHIIFTVRKLVKGTYFPSKNRSSKLIK